MKGFALTILLVISLSRMCSAQVLSDSVLYNLYLSPDQGVLSGTPVVGNVMLPLTYNLTNNETNLMNESVTVAGSEVGFPSIANVTATYLQFQTTVPFSGTADDSLVQSFFPANSGITVPTTLTAVFSLIVATDSANPSDVLATNFQLSLNGESSSLIGKSFADLSYAISIGGQEGQDAALADFVPGPLTNETLDALLKHIETTPNATGTFIEGVEAWTEDSHGGVDQSQPVEEEFLNGNIALQAPEPSTSSMLLGGVAVLFLGWKLGRGRKTSASPRG